MLARLGFLFIAAGWLTMSVLLWRSEYGARTAPNRAVPVETVWQKILTAPDSSQLEIKQHGKTVGFCRWAAEVGVGKQHTFTADEPVVPPEHCEISCGGDLALVGISNRLRFDFHVRLTTNHDWQEFALMLKRNSDSYEFHSRAAEKSVHFKMAGRAGGFEQDIPFSVLENPQSWLRQFGGMLPRSWLANPGLVAKIQVGRHGLDWQVHEDRLGIGHSSVRVYRLETRLLNHYPITLFVGRSGEILRVELPGDYVLVNQELAAP